MDCQLSRKLVAVVWYCNSITCLRLSSVVLMTCFSWIENRLLKQTLVVLQIQYTVSSFSFNLKFMKAIWDCSSDVDCVCNFNFDQHLLFILSTNSISANRVRINIAISAFTILSLMSLRTPVIMLAIEFLNEGYCLLSSSICVNFVLRCYAFLNT